MAVSVMVVSPFDEQAEKGIWWSKVGGGESGERGSG